MKKADGKSSQKEQLGMNPSTASGRLVKDLLFRFVVESGYRCFRCGEELTRDTFSVDHKVPWLHSEAPVELYFDLDNVSFSHFTCNSAAARRPAKYATKEELKTARIRQNKECKRRLYTTERRHAQYLRTGT